MNACFTFNDMLRANEEETARWRQWFLAHPEALDIPLDIADASDVRGMLVHIFAVELLYTERLVGKTRAKVSPADFPSDTLDALFGIHHDAVRTFREYIANWSDDDWQRRETFTTLSAGDKSASRRKMFIHAMNHSVRHWAQLATALRHAGLKQDWHHDFLYSSAME